MWSDVALIVKGELDDFLRVLLFESLGVMWLTMGEGGQVQVKSGEMLRDRPVWDCHQKAENKTLLTSL